MIRFWPFVKCLLMPSSVVESTSELPLDTHSAAVMVRVITTRLRHEVPPVSEWASGDAAEALKRELELTKATMLIQHLAALRAEYCELFGGLHHRRARDRRRAAAARRSPYARREWMRRLGVAAGAMLIKGAVLRIEALQRLAIVQIDEAEVSIGSSDWNVRGHARDVTVYLREPFLLCSSDEPRRAQQVSIGLISASAHVVVEVVGERRPSGAMLDQPDALEQDDYLLLQCGPAVEPEHARGVQLLIDIRLPNLGEAPHVGVEIALGVCSVCVTPEHVQTGGALAALYYDFVDWHARLAAEVEGGELHAKSTQAAAALLELREVVEREASIGRKELMEPDEAVDSELRNSLWRRRVSLLRVLPYDEALEACAARPIEEPLPRPAALLPSKDRAATQQANARAGRRNRSQSVTAAVTPPDTPRSSAEAEADVDLRGASPGEVRALAEARTRRRWRCAVRAVDMHVTLRWPSELGLEPVVMVAHASRDAGGHDGVWLEVARLKPLSKRVRLAIGVLSLIERIAAGADLAEQYEQLICSIPPDRARGAAWLMGNWGQSTCGVGRAPMAQLEVDLASASQACRVVLHHASLLAKPRSWLALSSTLSSSHSHSSSFTPAQTEAGSPTLPADWASSSQSAIFSPTPSSGSAFVKRSQRLLCFCGQTLDVQVELCGVHVLLEATVGPDLPGWIVGLGVGGVIEVHSSDLEESVDVQLQCRVYSATRSSRRPVSMILRRIHPLVITSTLIPNAATRLHWASRVSHPFGARASGDDVSSTRMQPHSFSGRVEPSLLTRELELHLSPLTIGASVAELHALVSTVLALQSPHLPHDTSRASLASDAEESCVRSSEMNTTDNLSGWDSIPMNGPLHRARDNSFWVVRFIRRLQHLHQRTASLARAPSPPLVLKTEIRVRVKRISFELRSDRPAAPPLLQATLEMNGFDASVQQRRSLASSAASHWHLWTADAVQAKLEAAMWAEYLNRKLGVLEPLIESWPLRFSIKKSYGDRLSALDIHAGVLNMNVSMELLQLAASLRALLTSEPSPPPTYELEPLDETKLQVQNRCGLPLWVALVSTRSSSDAHKEAEEGELPPRLEWHVVSPVVSEGPLSLPVTEGNPSRWQLVIALAGAQSTSQLPLHEEGTFAIPMRPRLQAHSALSASAALPFPLVCETKSATGNGRLVRVRSAVRLRNQCMATINVHCYLVSLPSTAPPRRRQPRQPTASPARDGVVQTRSPPVPPGSIIEEMFAVLLPREELEVPFWALGPGGLLRLRRQSVAHWEGPVDVHEMLTLLRGRPTVAAHPSLDYSVVDAMGDSGATPVTGLRLFNVLASATLISQPPHLPQSSHTRFASSSTSEGSNTTSTAYDATHEAHMSDIVLGLSWSARLHNLLPVDVEIQFGRGRRELEAADVVTLLSGEFAELPFGVDGIASSAAVDASGEAAAADTLTMRIRVSSKGVAWRWTNTLFLVSPQHLADGGTTGWLVRESGSASNEASERVRVALGESCSAHLGVEHVADTSVPRLVIWAPYWLINKTGLRLAYHLRTSPQQLLEPTFDTADIRNKDEANSSQTDSETSLLSGTADTLPSVPLMLACDQGEQLVVQVRPYGHQHVVGGRIAAIRAPAIRGLVRGRRSGRNRLAVGCSDGFSMDALGSKGEITFEGGGVLGCTIEPAPGVFQMISTSLVICPRYVVINKLPATLALRADLELANRQTLDLNAHVEVDTDGSADIYCFNDQELDLPSSTPGASTDNVVDLRASGFAASVDGGLGDEVTGVGKPVRVLRVQPASGFWSWSPPLQVDVEGEAFFYLQHDPPLPSDFTSPPLICANLRVRGCTIFITLCDVSRDPPYRIENHCPRPFWYMRPHNDGITATELSPRTWAHLAPIRGMLGVGALWSDRLRKPCIRLCTNGEKKRGAWHEISVAEIRQPRPIQMGREVFHVTVELHGRTRVVFIKPHASHEHTAVPRLMAWGLQANVLFVGLGVSLIHEDAASGRPQELLNATCSALQLQLASDTNLMEIQFTVSRLQLDNLLPTSHHPIALRIPSYAAGQSKRSPSSGDLTHHSGIPGRNFALRINVLRRASGQLQLLSIEVRPIEMALEASLFLHAGRLLSAARRSAIAGVSRAALVSHLGACLAEPPDWSGRQPLPCDVLRISSISVKMSSWLDFQVNDASDAATSRSSVGFRSAGNPRAAGVADWLTVIQQIPLFGSLFQAMVVLVKGVGIHLANVSGVPFKFDALHIAHPAATLSELGYMYCQRLSWQAAAQLGKLIGHSHLLGNPFGLISSMSNGVVGLVRGVQMGIVHGDGDQIVRSGYHFMGHLVGGLAAAGARLTGSLHSVVEQLDADQSRPVELRFGGDIKDNMRLGARDAVKRVGHGFTELWKRTAEGAQQHGTLGLAQGVVDGVGGLALSVVAATLQAGTQLISSVEQATLGDSDSTLSHVRPARSFFNSPRLLPLSECTMRALEVRVHALQLMNVERGSVYIELSLHEPGYGAARERRFSVHRTWLQGFRWQGESKFEWEFDVRSLDARLVVRALQRTSNNRLRKSKCLGSFAVRLSSIRALCRPPDGDTGSRVDGMTKIERFQSSMHWFTLRPRSKRREALQAEEQHTVEGSNRDEGRNAEENGFQEAGQGSYIAYRTACTNNGETFSAQGQVDSLTTAHDDDDDDDDDDGDEEEDHDAAMVGAEDDAGGNSRPDELGSPSATGGLSRIEASVGQRFTPCPGGNRGRSPMDADFSDNLSTPSQLHAHEMAGPALLPSLALSFTCHVSSGHELHSSAIPKISTRPSGSAELIQSQRHPPLPTLSAMSVAASSALREQRKARARTPSPVEIRTQTDQLQVAVQLLGFHSVRRKGLLNKRPYLRYIIGIGPRTAEGPSTSWKVFRRFSQFYELHEELASQLPRALERSGARLPSKFRLPGSLEDEGKARLGPLQLYLDQLMTIEALRRSEPLAHFVGTSHEASRLAFWEEALGTILSSGAPRKSSTT